MTAAPLGIASFKLRFAEGHVRVVPARDQAGCPFAGPGVDLRGEAAKEAFALARPMLAWFEALEPGIVLRSLSFDLARGKVLATIDVPVGRPRVVRVDRETDAGSTSDLESLAAPLLAHLDRAAREKLAARRAHG